MGRTSQAGSWGLIIALSGSAAGADDGPPPLTLPAEVPAQVPAAPAAPRPAGRDPLRPSTNLLRPRTNVARPAAVPTPPANQGSPFAITAPSPTTDLPVFNDAPPSLEPSGSVGVVPGDDAPPPLDGPAEMRAPTERRPRLSTPNTSISTRRVGASPSTRPSADVEQVLEPERANDAPPSLMLEPTPSGGDFEPLPDSPNGEVGRGLNRELDRIEPQLPDDPRPSPSGRRRGLFGSSPAARNRENSGPGSLIKVDPRSDPAADASLKRKLEAKVKDAVGSRAEDIEVRVVDRNVVIKAKVDRFWNRRGVRRTIENLPALSGYKARVEIDD